MPNTPTNVKMKRLAFHVWLAPEGVDPDTEDPDELDYHHVVIHNADQLRGELEAGRLKMDPRKAPMHLSTLWLWAALVRTERYHDKFQEFRQVCVSYEPDNERDAPHTDPDPELDDLDEHPTEASSS